MIRRIIENRSANRFDKGLQERWQMTGIANLDLDFLPAYRKGIYLVGGTVRDALMGKQPSDFDLAVSGDIAGIAADIAERCGGRVVDLGGKKGFAVLRVAAPSLTIDITPLDNCTIEANLGLRDFSVNAMAYDVEKLCIVDCVGGLSDLDQKVIRMVSEEAFTKDPARLTRAYRMAAMLGFHISPPTRSAIGRHSDLIDHVPGERIWSELVKLFSTQASSTIVRDMASDGLLTAIFPELEPTIGCHQNRFHQYDVFEHSLRTYTHVETLVNRAKQKFGHLITADELANLIDNGPLMKYTALLHDVGKPVTRKIDTDGRIHFAGHASRGETLATKASQRLRLSKQQRETAGAIIRNHVRPLFLFLAMKNGTPNQRGIVRFFRHAGGLTIPILVHGIADCMAKHAELQHRDREFIGFCNHLMADYEKFRAQLTTAPPLVNGNDLIDIFDLAPSPLFKKILRCVEERWFTGELSTREEALDWIKAHLSSRPENGIEEK